MSTRSIYKIGPVRISQCSQPFYQGYVTPPLVDIPHNFGSGWFIHRSSRSYYLFFHYLFFTTCNRWAVSPETRGQKVGGFTVDNWSESPLPVDKPGSSNRLGSPRNSFQQADGYKPSAARPGPHSGA